MAVHLPRPVPVGVDFFLVVRAALATTSTSAYTLTFIDDTRARAAASKTFGSVFFGWACGSDRSNQCGSRP